MQIEQLSLNTNILSLGALLGTSGNQSLIDSINARCGGASFFGSMSDPFRTNFENFMVQVIQPIREAQAALQQTSQYLKNDDVYRPINSLEELEKGIPPCMRLGILYYPPIRTMLDEDRIDGWGISPKSLQEGDPYADPLRNDYVVLHSTTVGPKGEYEIVHVENTTDPVMSATDVEALRETREFIDQFMNEEMLRTIDFTNYPNLHA